MQKGTFDGAAIAAEFLPAYHGVRILWSAFGEFYFYFRTIVRLALNEPRAASALTKESGGFFRLRMTSF